MAAYDTGLTEQSLDSRVAAGNGTRMTGGCPAATFTATCLDGSYATPLADEAAGMKEKLVGIGNILNIEEFDVGVCFWIEMLVHILQNIFNANLFAIANRPNAIEL
jgi:hypothetical protein